MKITKSFRYKLFNQAVKLNKEIQYAQQNTNRCYRKRYQDFTLRELGRLQDFLGFIQTIASITTENNFSAFMFKLDDKLNNLELCLPKSIRPTSLTKLLNRLNTLGKEEKAIFVD